MMRYALPVSKQLVPQWHYCYYNSEQLEKVVEVIEKLTTIHIIIMSKLISFGKASLSQQTKAERGKDKIAVMNQIKKCNQNILIFRNVELQVIYLFSALKINQIRQKFKFYKIITGPLKIGNQQTIILIQNVYIESGFLIKLIESTFQNDKIVTSNHTHIANKLEEIAVLPPFRKLQRIYILVKKTQDEVKEYYFSKKSLKPTKSQIKELKDLPNYADKISYNEYLCFGLLCGIMAFLLGLLLIIIHINNIDVRLSQKFASTFPAWRGLSYIIFYIWVLGFNLIIFEYMNINYKRIMHFGSNNIPTAASLLQFAALSTIVYLTLFIIYTLSLGGQIDIHEFLPQYCIGTAWGLILFALFFPITFQPISKQMPGRNFAQLIILKMLISWIIGVDYCSNWLSEQLSSFKLPFQDLAYTIMLFLYGNRPENLDTALFAGAIIGSSMFGLRILQAINRGIRERAYFCAKPYFRGTLKCIFNITTIWMSYNYRRIEKLDDEELTTNWMIIWACSATLSSSYAFIFDLFIDWNYLTLCKDGKCLHIRENIIYPRILYGIVIFINLFLRVAWVFTFSSDFTLSIFGEQNMAFFTLGVGYAEIIRRGMWNLLVIEKDHIKNCMQFEANVDATQIQNRAIARYKKVITSDSIQQIIKEFQQTKKLIALQKSNLRIKIAATQSNNQYAIQYVEQTHKNVIEKYEQKYNIRMNDI